MDWLQYNYYYVQDALYNVRALVSDSGYTIEEQTTYDAYGMPFNWCSGDADGDGDVDEDDLDLYMLAENTEYKFDEDYNWRCDVNLDNSVNSTDGAAFDNNDGTATRADQVSFFTNPYFFTGRRVDVLDNGNLTLQFNRNRYYHYQTGRWLTQDPLGYIDSLSLYQYGNSNPIIVMDPLGGCSDNGNTYDPFQNPKCFCVDNVSLTARGGTTSGNKLGGAITVKVTGTWHCHSEFLPIDIEWWEWWTETPNFADDLPAEQWNELYEKFGSDFEGVFGDINYKYWEDESNFKETYEINDFPGIPAKFADQEHQKLYIGLRAYSSCPKEKCTKSPYKPYDEDIAWLEYKIIGGFMEEDYPRAGSGSFPENGPKPPPFGTK